MKKYVFMFSFLTFVFNVNSAGASNCAPGDLFDTTTGQACTSVTVSTDCKIGDLFRAATGQPCASVVVSADGNDSVAIDKFFALFSSNNFKLGSKGQIVKDLQQFLKNESYYFGKVDGRYGKITDRAVKDFRDDNNIVSVNVSSKVPKEVNVINSNSNTTSGITVISPNGGEIIKQGENIAIKWLSKNVPANSLMNINVVNRDNVPLAQPATGLNPNATQSFVWNVDVYPGKYKVSLEFYVAVPISFDNEKGLIVVSDLSDEYFTVTLPSGQMPVAPVIDSKNISVLPGDGVTVGTLYGSGLNDSTAIYFSDLTYKYGYKTIPSLIAVSGQSIIFSLAKNFPPVGQYQMTVSNDGITMSNAINFTVREADPLVAGSISSNSSAAALSAEEISKIQDFLISQGYLSQSADPRGVYGVVTQQAIAAFQSLKGISPADGNLGPITRAAINALLTN